MRFKTLLFLIVICIIHRRTRKWQEEQARLRLSLNRFKSYYHNLNVWLSRQLQGKSISSHLQKMNINKVVVYGYGELGKRLVEDLITNVTIAAVIDQNPPDSENPEISELYCPVHEWQGMADVPIIVTPYYAFSAIRHNLLEKGPCGPVISLDDLIRDL